MELLSQIEVFATQLGASPWLLALVFILVVVDGVFPPMPSETVLVTAAVLAAGSTGPHLLPLILVAAAGAVVGDVIAFTLGRRLPAHRLPGLRGERGALRLVSAATALDRRGTTLVVTGRFIPVGRVAVNVSAGALGFPGGRFVVAASAAGVLWAGYTSLLGIGAQSLLGGNTLLSVTLGVLAGVLTGLAIEALVRRNARTETAAVTAGPTEYVDERPLVGAASPGGRSDSRHTPWWI